MRELFIDRDEVLDALIREVSEEGFRVVIVYGRRRVGKTWLAKALMREVGGHYVFVPECDAGAGAQILASKLGGVCSELRSDSWEALIRGLITCASRLNGLTVIIDEFQRLGREFASQLQALIDSFPDVPLKLVLLGSSVSVIDRLAGPLGPLYGRGLVVRLGGFRFLESYVYLRERLGASADEAFRIYSVFGGSPYNLSLVGSVNVESELLKHVHSIYGRLYEEPLHMLASETRELGVYASILSALATGRNTFSKLAQVVRRTSLIKYLEVLKSLGVVERLVPATEDPARSKKAKYVISDPYWDYWFKAIYPRREEAEVLGSVSINHKTLNQHYAQWFEHVVRELLTRTLRTPVRPWWSKNTEVDAIALTKEGVIAYEIKYSAINEAEAARELRKLKAKLRELPHPIIETTIIAKEVQGNPEHTINLEQLINEALRKNKISIKYIHPKITP